MLAVRAYRSACRCGPWLRSPCRGCGRQRYGERITTEHHQRNEPPDGPLAVGVGADEFGDVAYWRGLGLELARLSSPAGAFRPEGGQRTGFAISLIGEAG